jgi:hypothetical protein
VGTQRDEVVLRKLRPRSLLSQSVLTPPKYLKRSITTPLSTEHASDILCSSNLTTMPGKGQNWIIIEPDTDTGCNVCENTSGGV